MMSVIQKSTNLSTALKATSYVVAVPPSPSLSPTSLLKEEFPHKTEEKSCKVYLSSTAMKSNLPAGFGRLSALSSITNSAQFRFTHHDVSLPDLTKFRRVSTKDPTKPASKSIDQRRVFTYIFTGGALACTALGAKTAAVKFVMYYAMNQDALAAGAVEIDVSKVPEGKSLTFKWQGKPLFIKHRTPEEIAEVRSFPLSELRDPESDENRVKNEKYLIALGVCTHLGCVPIPNKGICLGGYFCPCHGSHYDASGRIRKGPAPLNLEIPEYKFIDDTTIVVGREMI